LGLASYGFGFNTSDTTNAPMNASGISLVNPTLSGIYSGGATNGTGTQAANAGDIDHNSITQAGAAGNLTTTTAAGLSGDNIAVSTVDLFTGVEVDLLPTATGSFTVTPDEPLAATAYLAYNSGGTTSTQKPVYKNVTASVADTFTSLPTLTIVVSAGTTTTPTPTHQAIISLLSGAVSQPTYGQADGTITMTGGHGIYNVTTAAGFTTSAIGSIAVTGFNPTSDTEIYALKVTNASAGTFTTAQILTIINDINGTGAGIANTSAGVVASQVSGSVYATLFPGYQILLTSVGVTDSNLAFDFTGDAETDASAPSGIVVTGVAAVPEPATAAGIVLGAAGLLLGRRRNKLEVT
jgi:hypothetical protein